MRTQYQLRKRKIEAITNGTEKFISTKCVDCGNDRTISDVKYRNRCKDCETVIKCKKSQARYQSRKKLYHSLLIGKECAVCGESNPILLEFAHDDRATKEGLVCEMIVGGSVEKALVESRKCTIKCGNCHQKETNDENNSWRSKYARLGMVPDHGRRVRRHRFMLDYLLEHPCAVCGETDVRCLELDHVDPSSKAFTIASASSSLEKIREEVKKCQVLCTNHHKIKTYMDRLTAKLKIWTGEGLDFVNDNFILGQRCESMISVTPIWDGEGID